MAAVLNSSLSVPPSSLFMVFLVKRGGDVIIIAAPGRRSPAICSVRNLSYGLSALSALISQSLYRHNRTIPVLFVSFTISIPGKVQPHSCPSFAVLRRCQQRIYKFSYASGRSSFKNFQPAVQMQERRLYQDWPCVKVLLYLQVAVGSSFLLSVFRRQKRSTSFLPNRCCPMETPEPLVARGTSLCWTGT